jgi:hypothetical protein
MPTATSFHRGLFLMDEQMPAGTSAADRFQYPPGDFRWRLWLLIERVDEVFAAAQRAGRQYF